MTISEIFPRGIAQGRAFYDRVQERAQLKKNIEHTVHTVLIAPRRYGKTSLMTQVLYENSYPHIWLDFMTITGREDAQLKVLRKIEWLITQVAPAGEKLKVLVTKHFAALKPEIVFKLPGVELKLHSRDSNREDLIEALISLDGFASSLKRRLVIVCDEFQEILRIDKDATLQASIRHAAERAKFITYLFSGSQHRTLQHMFHGKQNPLYALCEPMALLKISASEYVDFINCAALERWRQRLDDEVMAKILEYTDRYPKYINALCGMVWLEEMPPSVKVLGELWNSLVISRKTDIASELSELTLTQRKLLQWLCQNQRAGLYSMESALTLKMSQSSIQKAVAALLGKSLVDLDDAGDYLVLDPTLRSYFQLF